MNTFSSKPEGMLLEGEKGTETEKIDVWSEMEDVYFRRANKKALDTGTVIQFERSPEPGTRRMEQYSDGELREVINYRYPAFQKALSEVTSEATAYRVLELAQEMEKSKRIEAAIKAKLAELQAGSQPIKVK